MAKLILFSPCLSGRAELYNLPAGTQLWKKRWWSLLTLTTACRLTWTSFLWSTAVDRQANLALTIIRLGAYLQHSSLAGPCGTVIWFLRVLLKAIRTLSRTITLERVLYSCYCSVRWNSDVMLVIDTLIADYTFWGKMCHYFVAVFSFSRHFSDITVSIRNKICQYDVLTPYAKWGPWHKTHHCWPTLLAASFWQSTMSANKEHPTHGPTLSVVIRERTIFGSESHCNRFVRIESNRNRPQ